MDQGLNEPLRPTFWPGKGPMWTVYYSSPTQCSFIWCCLLSKNVHVMSGPLPDHIMAYRYGKIKIRSLFWSIKLTFYKYKISDFSWLWWINLSGPLFGQARGRCGQHIIVVQHNVLSYNVVYWARMHIDIDFERSTWIRDWFTPSGPRFWPGKDTLGPLSVPCLCQISN